MVFNRSLSQEEVLALYNNTANRLYQDFTDLADGTYDYRAYAMDSAGNLAITETRNVTVQDTQITACRTITSPGTYTLMNNISSTGTCIQVQSDDVIIDGQGYTINYSDGVLGYGIDNSGGYDNVTVKNTIIKQTDATSSNDGSHGIYFDSHPVVDAVIYNNTITTLIDGTSPVTSHGIYAQYADLINITSNTVNITGRDSHGIYLRYSENATIHDNTVTVSGRAGHGIYLRMYSHYANITNNKVLTLNTGYHNYERSLPLYLALSGDAYLRDNQLNGTYATSIGFEYPNMWANHDIDQSNTGFGLPIYYNESLSDMTVLNSTDLTGQYRDVICAACTNVTYYNVTLHNVTFLLSYGSNNTVDSLNITSEFYRGIEIQDETNVVVKNTRINTTALRMQSLFFTYSKYGRAYDNELHKSGDGETLYMFSGWNNTLTNNTLTTYGTESAGVFIGLESTNNTFTNNTIDSYEQGISVASSTNTVSNYFSGNIITSASSTGLSFYTGTNSIHTFTNDIITSGSSDIYVDASYTGYVNFTNTTINKSDIDFEAGATAYLNFLEYVDVNVTNSTGGMLAGATITATDNNSVLRDSATSDGSSMMRLTVLTDMINITETYSYNNYTIEASLVDHYPNSTLINVTDSGVFTGVNAINLTLHVSDVAPVIVHNNTFFNFTAGHSFNVTAGVMDDNGAADIKNTSILYDSGSCVYSSNESSGDYFNVTYTCTGTPYTFTSLNITFCDYGDNCVTTPTSNNSYPNQAPSLPSLISPVNGNFSIRTRTPFFNWTVSSDVDGDVVNYTLNISNGYAPDYFRDNITANNHTVEEELWTEYEAHDNVYNWSVRACDAWDCSNYTGLWNFSIDDWMSITLINDEVTFGTQLALGSSNDTTNNIPQPFIFRNDGIIRINLTNVSATQPLWSSVGLNTRYWRWKVTNASEANSFDWASSLTTWQNASVMQTNQTVIGRLNYSDDRDEAAVDVAIEVPLMETGGAKTGTLKFTWRSAT